MDSTTTSSSPPPPPPYSEPYWVVSETVLILLTLGTLYLVVAITYHACKIEKRNRTTRRLVGLCIIAVTAGLARLLSDHMVAFIGWQSDLKCRITTSISVALYSCSIYPVYFFLWYRQNAFYTSPTFKHLLNKHVHNISIATLTILAVGGLAITVLYQIPSVTGWDFRATATGCRDAHDTQDVEVIPVLVILVSSLAQISLLGLLLYPLITNKRNQARMSASSIVRPSPRRQISGGNDLMKKAMLGAKRRREASDGEVIESRRTSIDSHQTLYNLQQSPHHHRMAANSDDESVRPFSVYSGYSGYTSESEAGFTSDYTVTSQSDHDSDREGRPSTSKSRRTNRQHSAISTNSSIFAKNTQSTPKRGRRHSGDSCRSSISRRIRNHVDTLKRGRRHRSRSQIKKEKKMKILIRKVFVLATVCVISDVFFTVIQLMFVVPEITYLMIFDINLFTNILCIILSFKEWKKILIAPFVHRCAKKKSGVTSPDASRTKITSLDRSNDSEKKVRAPDAVSVSSAAELSKSNSVHDTPEHAIPATSQPTEQQTTIL